MNFPELSKQINDELEADPNLMMLYSIVYENGKGINTKALYGFCRILCYNHSYIVDMNDTEEKVVDDFCNFLVAKGYYDQ